MWREKFGKFGGFEVLGSLERMESLKVCLRELGLPHDPSPECLQVQTQTSRGAVSRGCCCPERMFKKYHSLEGDEVCSPKRPSLGGFVHARLRQGGLLTYVLQNKIFRAK